MLVGVVGIAVTTVIALQEVELLPQLLDAFTQMFPLTAELPKFMLMEVVPCPDEIVAPVGTIQVYEVAPLTIVVL